MEIRHNHQATLSFPSPLIHLLHEVTPIQFPRRIRSWLFLCALIFLSCPDRGSGHYSRPCKKWGHTVPRALCQLLQSLLADGTLTAGSPVFSTSALICLLSDWTFFTQWGSLFRLCSVNKTRQQVLVTGQWEWDLPSEKWVGKKCKAPRSRNQVLSSKLIQRNQNSGRE